MAKSFDAKSFIASIEEAVKNKLRGTGLVSLDQFRKLHQKDRLPRILVIEDDDSVRKSLIRILEKSGLRVLTAHDGLQLSSVLDSEPIDLVILDVGLPWIDGFEIAKLMKAHPDLSKIPLVFVSGYCTKDDIKRGFAVGADDYIKKPFEVDEIQRSVSTLLVLNSY